MGYIYKTTNLFNGKIYVGQCRNQIYESEEYLGSGKLLKKAINKYSKENFKKEIVDVGFTDDLGERETYWIAFYKSYLDKTIGYNLHPGGGKGGNGGNNFTEHPYKDEIRIKMSNNRKGKTIGKKNGRYGKNLKMIWTEKYGSEIAELKLVEHGNKIAAHHTGKKRPNFSPKGDKNPNFGKHWSEEWKKNILIENIGRNQKISKSNTGRISSLLGKKACKKCRKFFKLEKLQIHKCEGKKND